MMYLKIVFTVATFSALLSNPLFSSEIIYDDNDIADVHFKAPSDKQIEEFVYDNRLGLATDMRAQAAGDEIEDKIGLTINGGGIRGLIPALYLKHLEIALEEADICNIKVPLYRIFDYVGGTSIGGILSLGVAANLSTDDMIEMFDIHRQRIFGMKRTVRLVDWLGLISNQYRSNGLEGLLQDTFQNQTLGDLKTDVLITACTSDGHPHIFKRQEGQYAYPIWEVGRSTSAAPTFFSAYQPSFNNQLSLIDGGVWVNNPSILVASSIVIEHQRNILDPSKLHILSLGTGNTNSRAIPSNSGLLHAGGIIDVLIDSQDRGNHLLMTQLLEHNYSRINPQLREAINLDNISQSTIDSLKNYGEQQPEIEQIKEFVNRNEKIIWKKIEKQD